MLEYKSVSELVQLATTQNTTISNIVLHEQMEVLESTESVLMERMAERLAVMLDSIEKGSQKGVRSTSGFSGGAGYLLRNRIEQNNTLCGNFVADAIQMAIAVSEINAAMGKIVAAPTAGSCGILPAVLGTMLKHGRASKEEIILALFTAGGLGMVIANKASISGAEGGCQAECGSASAMAAAAVVELSGGTPAMVADATAIAIKCSLGLVCDPVAGLVEIPCTKRNASGVSLALTSAEMVLAGITSAIPADDTIRSLYEVGCAMPSSLKETAEGGLAITPTGKMMHDKMFGAKGGVCGSCSRR